MAHLLFLTSGPIGDCVLSTGVLEWGRARLGGAPDVTIACGPAAAPLFRAVPGLRRVLAIHKRPGGLHWAGLWARLSSASYDLAIDLRGSLVGVGLSAGTRIRGRPQGADHKLAQLARVIGAAVPPEPRLHLDAAAHAAAAAFGAPALVLGPGGRFPGKRWPPERFAALARALDAEPLVLGGAGEEALCAAVAQQSGGRSLCGALDLPGAAALLARARLFVGNDSGLMHLAAAAGAPVIGLFGPSDEAVYAPFGPRTVALRGPTSYAALRATGWNETDPRSLLEELDVATVASAARRLMETEHEQHRV